MVDYQVHALNPLIAKLFNWKFHPPQVVSRWRDPQLQVCGFNSDFYKMEVSYFDIWLIYVTFYLKHVQKMV